MPNRTDIIAKSSFLINKTKNKCHDEEKKKEEGHALRKSVGPESAYNHKKNECIKYSDYPPRFKEGWDFPFQSNFAYKGIDKFHWADLTPDSAEEYSADYNKRPP